MVVNFDLNSWANIEVEHFIGCFRDTPDTGQPTGFCCVVLEAASGSECEEIVHRIGEQWNPSSGF